MIAPALAPTQTTTFQPGVCVASRHHPPGKLQPFAAREKEPVRSPFALLRKPFLQITSRTQVDRALSGDSRALRELIALLTPVVQGRVARVLLRSGSVRGKGISVQQEVEDLTQDVFERLFAQGGQALRAWEPERGAALSSFVGLIAERTTISTLRSRPKNRLTESPTDSAVLEFHTGSTPGPEQKLAAQQLTRTLVGRLEESLSPLGFQVFRALFCEEKSTEAVGEELGLSPDAVYAWRHRIKKAVLELSTELGEAPKLGGSSP